MATAAVVAPFLVSGSVLPATAASPSLTVTTIGRDGAPKVGAAVQILNAKTGKPYLGVQQSGRPVTVAPGQYVVVADIRDWNTDIDTIGAAVVTVSGTTKVTLDARRGTLLKVSLDTANAYEQELVAGICAGNQPAPLEAGGPAGKVYVIPNASSLLRFAYLSRWSSADGAYEAGGGTTAVPANPHGTFHAASMATVHVQSDRGPNGGTEEDLSFVPQGSPCQSGLGINVMAAPGPYSFTAHLAAGKWDIRSAEFAADGFMGSYDSVRDLAAGKSYSQIFYRAAWGPAHSLPYVRFGEIYFNTADMFQDPSATGFENRLKVTSTLSRGSVVVAKQTREVWTHVSHLFEANASVRGWYTLDVSAIRYHPGVAFPVGMLSPSARATFHFYADPARPQIAPVFLTRFVPSGLNQSNRAKPRSSTPVRLVLDRVDPHNGTPFHSDTAKTVQAWYSTSDGKTWHALHVTHTNSEWATAVPNPASGTISLNVKVTDAAGNSSKTIVNRAYSVA
ncbi:hypothetical protein Psi02_78880 [Planotetraspora silvatica]|uniref:Carboxypeptidase regulatory-like domain-containing protein n=1 Tax=Planotetraspora silvatica TaxID=234614 RepID=A0A8J3UZT9_9ACTN|nr:hypothetical protein [Planotetraspora silvatica]GII51464.1 hypothetical protein Psi02_78880 [Planotetraspora silvatica]